MKKNNKGFTLVEIIAVIGILLLMATITIPSLISMQNRNKNTTDKKTIELIENSAQIYFEMNRGKIGNLNILNTEEGLCLPLTYIMNDGLIKKPEGIDADNTYIKLTKLDKLIEYKYNGCNGNNIEFKNIADEKEYPMLAANSSWYKGSTSREKITKINIVDSYTGPYEESWPAAVDADNDGTLDSDIRCYINGTILTIAGNGSGGIYANSDSNVVFAKFLNVTAIDGIKFLDTSHVTDMAFMFNYCRSLTSLDLSNFKTSKVDDMTAMFHECNNLTSIDLTGFDTTNVTSMASMFYECNNLTSLDLTGFDTTNVTSMISMFNSCNSLTSLDLTSFDTTNVIDMAYMFYECNNLTKIYATTKFETTKVGDGEYMFNLCEDLVGGNGTKFSGAKVLDVSYARIDEPGKPGYFTKK